VPKPYLEHLESSQGLQTTYEAVRAGFVALALEKNRRATPHVAMARALRTAAGKARSAGDLPNVPDIQPALLTAAGLSDKAIKHLQDSDKQEAVGLLIKNFLEPAGEHFVEELVFRFLLTRGDALGGSMRNVAGVIAERRLARAIIAYVRLSGHQCFGRYRDAKVWAELPKDDADVELSLRGLAWNCGAGQRTLLHNIKVPLSETNVDLVLFDGSAENITHEMLASPEAYIALGELKGGIDPSGADEHWKTAKTALDRIYNAFSAQGYEPHTFFVGAAIVPKMAQEIWQMLEEGRLENAANLTDDNQVSSIAQWLCSL
jgi:hypothetical protein